MRGTVFLGALLLAASVSLAEDAKQALKSGPQAGKGVNPFNVKDITGPNKGKGPLCYV
jgi:hypothetical protein